MDILSWSYEGKLLHGRSVTRPLLQQGEAFLY